MTSIHEEHAHHFVPSPGLVEETVVHDDESAWIDGAAPECLHFLFDLFEHRFLSTEDVFDQDGVVFLVDEKFRHQTRVESVAGLCSRDDGADGYVLVVEEEVPHEIGLSRISSADQNDHGTLAFVRLE